MTDLSMSFGNGITPPAPAMSGSEPAGEYYELTITEGAIRIFGRTFAKGITLEESGLSWVLTNGQARRRPYRDIQSIHLDAQDRPELATCRITFVSGPPLRTACLLNVNGKRYGQFIADLHHRLHAQRIDTIQFHGGRAPLGGWVVGRIMIGACVLFALLGIGIALWTGHTSLKHLVIGPAFMLFAALGIWRSRPVTYTPDQVPERYFPGGFW